VRLVGAHFLSWCDPSCTWFHRWLLMAHSRDFMLAACARTDWPVLLALTCSHLPVDPALILTMPESHAQVCQLLFEQSWSLLWCLLPHRRGRRLLQNTVTAGVSVSGSLSVPLTLSVTSSAATLINTPNAASGAAYTSFFHGPVASSQSASASQSGVNTSARSMSASASGGLRGIALPLPKRGSHLVR
jgi:hypothetical protein